MYEIERSDRAGKEAFIFVWLRLMQHVQILMQDGGLLAGLLAPEAAQLLVAKGMLLAGRADQAHWTSAFKVRPLLRFPCRHTTLYGFPVKATRR